MGTNGMTWISLLGRVCLHWPSVAYALFTLGLSTPAGFAQDAPGILQTWHYFLERCSFAYTEPQRYLDDIVAGHAPSQGIIASTTDGQIRWGTTYDAVHSEGYQVTVVGDRRLESCEVMGMLDGSLARSAAFNEAFLQDVASRPDVVIAGGPMPETALGAGATAGIEAGTYRYGVLGVLPDEILAEVVISPWQVEIHSLHVEQGP
jgi:hypothetical protein